MLTHHPVFSERPSFVCLAGSPHTLAVAFQGGDVLLMRGYDDCIPQVIVKQTEGADCGRQI